VTLHLCVTMVKLSATNRIVRRRGPRWGGGAPILCIRLNAYSFLTPSSILASGKKLRRERM
jgi:hypothetical protein